MKSNSMFAIVLIWWLLDVEKFALIAVSSVCVIECDVFEKFEAVRRDDVVFLGNVEVES